MGFTVVNNKRKKRDATEAYSASEQEKKQVMLKKKKNKTEKEVEEDQHVKAMEEIPKETKATIAKKTEEEEEEELHPDVPSRCALEAAIEDSTSEEEDEEEEGDGEEEEEEGDDEEMEAADADMASEEEELEEESGEDDDDGYEVDSEAEEDEEDEEYDGVSSSVAGAMASILGKTVTDGSAPILVKDKTTDKRVAAEREERQAKRARREERREQRERGHDPKPSVLKKDYERKMLKIATRGVVKLFNAVSKHQKEVGNLEEEAGPSRMAKEKALGSLKKADFVDMLKKAPIGDEKTSAKTKGSTGEASTGGENKSWGVLKEDYMMNSRMKDWDKNSSESSSRMLGDLAGKISKKSKQAMLQNGDESEEEQVLGEGIGVDNDLARAGYVSSSDSDME